MRWPYGSPCQLFICEKSSSDAIISVNFNNVRIDIVSARNQQPHLSHRIKQMHMITILIRMSY